MASTVLAAASFCCAAQPLVDFRVQSVVASQTTRIVTSVGERGRVGVESRGVVLRRSGGAAWEGSNFEVAPPLDLTEENVEQVLLDARSELLQLFDVSVGITGVVQLVELDGPFVKVRLTGRFWHQRSMVLARVANYLQKRIPEIAEVEIEDEGQLDDSAANF